MADGDEPVIDLVALIERHGCSRLIHTNDGEYHGSCPFCGTGKDRFIVWSHSARYWCRVCNETGDCIDFLMHYVSMTFLEACEELGLEPDAKYRGTPVPEQSGTSPPALWIAAMKEVIDGAHIALLHSRATLAEQYRAYLKERGLTRESIERYHIGLNDKWIALPFEQVGLTEDMLNPLQWAKNAVRIPDGLLFPYFVGKSVWKVGIKRPFVTDMSRGQILGGKECWLNQDRIESGSIVVVTEAFLDAISVDQSCRDLVVSTSTDGTSNTRSQRCQDKLQSARHVLLALDADGPGDKAAEYWSSILRTSSRLRPVSGKDPNEMLTTGHNIREWVQQALSKQTESVTTSAPIIEPLDSPVSQEPLESDVDPLSICFLCGREVEHFTVSGWPCCSQHYAMQQAIDVVLSSSSGVEPPKMYTDVEAMAKVAKSVIELFGPCEMQSYSRAEHTIASIIELRKRQIAEQKASNEAELWQNMRDIQQTQRRKTLER